MLSEGVTEVQVARLGMDGGADAEAERPVVVHRPLEVALVPGGVEEGTKVRQPCEAEAELGAGDEVGGGEERLLVEPLQGVRAADAEEVVVQVLAAELRGAAAENLCFCR